MANQWYLQHGGKQYGPLTSAQLKKLAADGKIGPSSSVRLGESGNWTAANRVQGLFPARSPQASAPPVPLAAPPVAPPVAAPPMASPLARAALLPNPTTAKAAAPPPSMAAKLVGAVGLIFGILALATFWLPLLDPRMGWTGIVVGGLGLLLGIVGIVLSALHGGAALFLNVGTASSSLVGLVLTVVLGITTGMFSPKPVEIPPATLPPPVVQNAPAPAPATPEPEPEPELPPEIVWTDASEAIEQGPIRAKIAQVAPTQVRLESLDLTQMRRTKPQPMLQVSVTIENISPDKMVSVPGWNGPAPGLAGGVGELLKGSELGDQLASATATATMTDQAGNFFPQTPAIRLSAAQADMDAKPTVRPGESVQKAMLFEPPLDSSEYLRLELPAAGFGGNEPLRFQIPRSMFAPQ